MGQDGWPFADVDEFPGADADPLNGAKHVKDLYYRADPNYNGRCVSHCRSSRQALVLMTVSQLYGSRSLGQEDFDDREQRELGDHPHVQLCVQRPAPR